MVPTGQRLDAHDPPGGQLDDGLVVRHELAAVQCVGQLGLQRQPLHDGGVHVGVEHLVTGLALALGRVHGHVRLAEQIAGVVDLAAQGDTDAGRQHHGTSVDDVFLRQPLDQ